MLIRNLTIAALCVYAAALVLFFAAGIRILNGLTVMTRAAATAHSAGVSARGLRKTLEDVLRARGSLTKEQREKFSLELDGALAQVAELTEELGNAPVPTSLREAALGTAASWKMFDTAARKLLGATAAPPGAAAGAVRELTVFGSSLENLTLLLNGTSLRTQANYKKGFIVFAAYFLAAWSLIGAFIVLRVVVPLSDIAKKLDGSLASGTEPVFGAAYTGELSCITGYIGGISSLLKDASTSWRMFEETIVCPVIELDASGKVLYMNAAACKITGYRPEELIGADFSGLVPSNSLKAFVDFLGTVLQGETVLACESSLIFKTGEVNHIVYNAAPVLGRGRTLGCLISFGDEAGGKITADKLEIRHQETKELKEKLGKITRELEEYAVMAVRREYKMQEIRERLQFLKDSLDTEKRPRGL